MTDFKSEHDANQERINKAYDAATYLVNYCKVTGCLYCPFLVEDRCDIGNPKEWGKAEKK